MKGAAESFRSGNHSAFSQRLLFGLLVAASMAGCGAHARGISLAQVAGTWEMRAFSAVGDSVLGTYNLWIPNDTVWRMKFINSPDTVRVHVLSVNGDSIRVQVGPYTSSLRPGVRVTSFSTYRLRADTLIGRSVAHYAVATPDSIRRVRTVGTRISK